MPQSGRFRLADIDPPAPQAPMGRFRLDQIETPAPVPPPAPRPPTPARGTGLDVRSLERTASTLTRPLWPMAEGARRVADRLTDPNPSLVRDALGVSLMRAPYVGPGTSGDLNVGAPRGLAAGLVEGGAGVLESMTSPVGIAATLAGGGAEAAAARNLPRTTAALRAIESGAGATFAAQGAHETTEGFRTGDPFRTLMGVGTVAGGAAGTAHGVGVKKGIDLKALARPVLERGRSAIEGVGRQLGRFKLSDIDIPEPHTALPPIEAPPAPPRVQAPPVEPPPATVTSSQIPDVTPAPAPRPPAPIEAPPPARVETPAITAPQPPDVIAPPEASPAPAERPIPKTFVELPALERREVRRILLELDNFQFDQPGRPRIAWWKHDGPDDTYLASAREPNANVYGQFQSNTRRTGRQLRDATRKWIEGSGRMTSIVADVVREARRRAEGGEVEGAYQLPPEAGEVPGEIYVERRRRGKQDAAIEDQVATALEQEPQRYIDEHRQRHGNVINADDALELFAPYNESVEARTRHQAATRGAAAALIERRFREALDEPVGPGQQPEVVFTAGGTGSGKSTARTIGAEFKNAHVVLDSTFADYPASRRKIMQARQRGLAVTISDVYRDPVDAYVNGVLPRAETTGRTVSVDTHVRTHIEAQRAVLQAFKDFGDEFDVAIVVRESLPNKQLVERDLGWLEEQVARYNDPDALRAEITARLDAEHAAGRVSDRVYEASRGNAPSLPGARDEGAGPDRPDAGDRSGAPAVGEGTREGRPARPGAQGQYEYVAAPARPPSILDQLTKTDRLSTGEEQPRLPGDVGDVRDREVATPQFQVPRARPEDFELTAPTPKPPKENEGQGSLFEPQAATGSPTRALYHPGNALAQVRTRYTRRPVSEPQVVERLQHIFAERQPTNILERVAFGPAARELPVRTGRFRQRAFGVYFPEQVIVRLKKTGDLTTFTHELGHHIDFARFKDVGRPVGVFKGELMKLGAATTPPSKIGTDYHVAEGVAEYFRIWFADPTQAEGAAPAFSQALGDVMNGAPKFAAQLREAQGLVQRYLEQPVDVRGAARVNVRPLGVRGRARDVLEELRSNRERGGYTKRLLAALRDTGELPAAARDRRGWWDGVMTRAVDRHQAIWRAMRDVAPDLPPSMNAYVLTRLADKAPAMAEGFLAVGPRGTDGTFTGPSLEAVLRPVHDRLYPTPHDPQKPNLATYLVALRARELHLEGKGRDPGMPLEEADAIIKRTAADPDFARIQKARDGIYKFLDGMRLYAQEYGAMSAEQVAKLQEAIFYVPLMRVRPETEAPLPPGAAKYADRQSPLKRLKGSGRDVVDPIESITRNTFALVSFVERNRAARALAKELTKVEGSGAILQEIATPQEATTFDLKQVQRQALEAAAQAGVLDPDALLGAWTSGALDQAFEQLATVYTPTAFGRPGERILFVMDHGQRRFFQVQDEALYQNLVALGPGQVAPLMALAGKAASALRAGVTLRPTFVARNLVRDTIGAFFQSRHGFLPIYDSARGLLGQLRKDADYQQFRAWGIDQATLLGNDRNKLRSAIDRATSPARWPSKAFRPVRHPLEFLQEFSAAVESATRLGEFKLALDTGGKERRAGVLGLVQRAGGVLKKRPPVTEEVLTKAALAASDVTVDFSRGGTWAKSHSTVAAFFNARLQGLVRGVETASRDPLGVTLTGAAMATTAAVLWDWNHRDPVYRELDPQKKRDYWFVRLPGTEHWLTVPKPFEWSIFANVTEAALEETARTSPAALHPLRDFANSGGRDFILTVMPTIAMPTLEVLSNHDFYRGRPIVSEWKKGQEPDLQVNDWTSDTFRVLGQALGVSPAKLEHWATRTFGQAASDVTDATDPVAKHVLERTRPAGPAAGVERVPGLQALIAPRRIDSRAASVEEFYKRWNEIEGSSASLRRYEKGGGQTNAADYRRELGATWPPDFVPRMKAAKQQIDDLRDRVDEVHASALSPAEKRRRIDDLNAQIARAARFGLEGRVQ